MDVVVKKNRQIVGKSHTEIFRNVCDFQASDTVFSFLCESGKVYFDTQDGYEIHCYDYYMQTPV